MIKIFFIGDINGRPGRDALASLLGPFVKEHGINFVIANGENSAAGFGITAEVTRSLLGIGINAITTGNHIWDKKDIIHVIDHMPELLRPNNLPPGNPGKGFGIFEAKNEAGEAVKVGVICLVGRIFMQPVDCPFRSADFAVEEIRKTTPVIITDMHAEATSEKQALAYYLDGRVSAVLGTHTHVQTADERILRNGTAYLTDAGMTGSVDSVIGVKKEMIVRKFLTFMPEKFEIADKEVKINGAVVTVDEKTGRSISIERIIISA